MMNWITDNDLYALHDKQIADSGGDEGIRDIGLLQSALAAPQNLLSYEPESDIARLAACYGYRITNNHAFVDGNKRTGFITMLLFLSINGFSCNAGEAASYEVMMQVSTKSITELEFADWIRKNIKPL